MKPLFNHPPTVPPQGGTVGGRKPAPHTPLQWLAVVGDGVAHFAFDSVLRLIL